jgi:O-antigen/teichoic acid export membrane protein
MLGTVGLGYPPDGRMGAVSALLATYVTMLGQLVGATATMNKTTGKAQLRLIVRRWLAMSLPIFLVDGFFLLMNANMLMVGIFMSPADVTVHFATLKRAGTCVFRLFHLEDWHRPALCAVRAW